MPLEFALRPRFDLEQNAPQRKLRKPRVSPLALPMLAYWLAIAGATELLLRSAADEPAQSERTAAPLRAVEIDAQPSVPASTPTAAVAARSSLLSAPAERSAETLPGTPVASESGRDLERAFAPSPPAQQTPGPRVPERAVLPPGDGPTPARRNDVNDAPVKREWQAPAGHESARVAARASERPVADEPERTAGHPATLPSCESAAASANETMDLGAGPGAPDLSRESFASVLENGAYLGTCAIPPRTAVEICAAVQDGKAVGVSVTSEPRDATVNACVRRAVAALRFPRSVRLDVTRTRFAAAR